jgi:hypothetical protein
VAPLAGDDAPSGLLPLIDILRQRDSLQWFPELALGYYPVKAPPTEIYNAAYFAKYEGYAATDLGRTLNRIRVAFVRKYYAGEVVDVGIGCGSFVRALGARGYDVSPTAIRWLMSEGLFHDPYIHGAEAVTLWDTLEHVEDFPALLRNVRSYVFMSLPIFRDMDEVLLSKHYRKNEHCWYFTQHGLIMIMARLGWQLISANDAETKAGRANIGSFAFQRE